MAKTITIFNRKGGVAKSITAFVLAWYIAMQGLKVLVIDTDSQANLTKRLLDGQPDSDRKLIDILTEGFPIRPSEIRKRIIDNVHQVDFIEASLSLTGIEGQLDPELPKDYILVDALSEVASNYEYIVIDTPPAAELLSRASLMAADEVIIPCTPDTLGLEGVMKTMNIVERLQGSARGNPKLRVAGILVTKFPSHKRVSADNVVAALHAKYGDKVVGTPVREGDAVERALTHNLPVIAYAPHYYVSIDYVAAIKEMFPEI